MIINKYFKGYEVEDLYQVGVLGVIKAYNNYLLLLLKSWYY